MSTSTKLLPEEPPQNQLGSPKQPASAKAEGKAKRKAGTQTTQATQSASKAAAKAIAKDEEKPAKQKAKQSKKAKAPSKKDLRSITLGSYAHTVLAKQYERLIQQEEGVLADRDPEHLHQMRVSSRRLRTALRVFEAAVDLPKPARAKPVQALTRVLGQLRDLDVQMADLQDHYRPQVPAAEQQIIDQSLQQLAQRRVEAFKQVQTTLTRSKYKALKDAYAAWLDAPQYQALADLPVSAALADLLSPLLSELLLHPGWWVASNQRHTKAGLLLHELRKTCKHARYQAEFFIDFYDDEFEQWVEELKQLQEKLGQVQDSHVLLEILTGHSSADLSSHSALAELPALQEAIDQQQTHALADWDKLRTQYLEPRFRRSLYQLILSYR